jgi:hypothetical protein
MAQHGFSGIVSQPTTFKGQEGSSSWNMWRVSIN